MLYFLNVIIPFFVFGKFLLFRNCTETLLSISKKFFVAAKFRLFFFSLICNVIFDAILILYIV
jgi:hypothetical protein